MNSGGAQRYDLFGLAIDSDLHLPELAPGAKGMDSRPADLTMRIGQPTAHVPGAYVLDIPRVARFTISEGSAITIEPVAGAEEREIRLFLLGSAMGAALHQRGILPLHANAVAIDRRAIAFMGRSGAGKSTLAAWFHDQGYPILADDVCVVRIGEDGKAWAYPGLPRLRLWQDALEASGRDASNHSPSFHVSGDSRRKFDVLIPATAVAGEPLPLAALFSLEEDAKFEIECLSGSQAVEAISTNTYRGRLIAEVGDSLAHITACVMIARKVPAFRLARPFNRSGFDAQCRQILAYCRSMAPSG